MSILYELFGDLPRQGPGDDASTRRAFEMLPSLPACAEILDIGCGSGAQTIALAQLTLGRVTAVDTHAPFLEAVRCRAEAAGVDERVIPVHMSMTELRFPDGRFDILWSEGAIYLMGFAAGLRAWRALLKPGGYVVVSEATWFRDSPPAEIREYWAACYPSMGTVASNLRAAAEAGYHALGTFPLPSASWWAPLYDPLARKLPALRRKYATDSAALAEIQETEREIEMFRKYSDAYGYEFYVLQRP